MRWAVLILLFLTGLIHSAWADAIKIRDNSNTDDSDSQSNPQGIGIGVAAEVQQASIQLLLGAPKNSKTVQVKMKSTDSASTKVRTTDIGILCVFLRVQE